jgi:hypothetical protein
VTAFITPVYNSAPKGVQSIGIIQSREGNKNVILDKSGLYGDGIGIISHRKDKYLPGHADLDEDVG